MSRPACSLGCLLELHWDMRGRVILAQRVALPVLWHQDAGEVGVVAEADPEHVESLTFVRLAARPEVEQARDDGFVGRDLAPHPQALLSRKREQLDDDF